MASGYKQLPNLTGQQSSALNQLLALLGGTGAGGAQSSLETLLGFIQGTPESYESFEAPIKRQFQEEVLPALQERLTGLGAGGGRSSGATQILGQAGERLSENLAAQRGQLQQSSIQQLLNTYLGGLGLGLGTKPFGYMAKSPSFASSFGSGLGSGLGSLLGALPGLFF